MAGITAALIDSWADTKGMLPLLFLLFLGLEFFQHQRCEQLGELLRRAGVLGPLIGAGLGIIPQCGSSVPASLLYLQGCITPGTLLAVFLSTSDEAIPVILAQPGRLATVAPLLAIKLMVGVSGGYITDLILVPKWQRPDYGPTGSMPVGSTLGVQGPPGLPPVGVSPGRPAPCVPVPKNFQPALAQTVQIYLFAFLATAALTYGSQRLGVEQMAKLLLAGSSWQIPLAAVLGLIPNCVVSVVITQLYLEGALGFGATVAGLASAAGLGLLVLLRHNRSWLDSLRIMGLLVGFAVAGGMVLELVLT